MTRAISRDSFDELKQYLGVHLQQGRVILDADWNEGQDIMASLARRLGQDAFRNGVVNEGFEIQPVIPVPWAANRAFENTYFQAGLPLLLRFPRTAPFDSLESKTGWALSPAGGNLRTNPDRPYEGTSFLRISEHTGQTTVTKTIGGSGSVDLSAFQFADFRFRLNRVPASSGTASFFIEDTAGNRNTWRLTAVPNAAGVWTPGAALPLDLRFSIVDLDLLPAFTSVQYVSTLLCVGAPAGVTWTVPPNTLPPGLSLTAQGNSNYVRITGAPTTPGSFTFTVTASSGGQQVPRTFTLAVQAAPARPEPFDYAGIANDLQSFWDQLRARTSITNGPANLSSIHKYGFEIFQSNPPLIWDFDALRFTSRDMVTNAAANNFVISGSLQQQLIDFYQSDSLGRNIVGSDTPNSQVPTLQTVRRTFDRAPRAYVAGFAATQPRDVLYSDQADPNDPPLAVPPGTAVRGDLVYLDVWREPVTYVEDPDLREIALGGPDTATRMRLRQRVRVAQGGTLPTDGGIGAGTLATAGSYTDTANRLYLVEVDTAGDIGAATVRWSEDNGSTIQRVIEAVPKDSTKIKVEDASAFRPGDLILLRKEFGAEEHQISGIVGNTITLQQKTGLQLQQLPAAAHDPSFTTFALADHPKIQRWNAFHVLVAPDPNDSTISAAIALSHGVSVLFGGNAFKKGDFWTFRARYLVGDESTGISATRRIETLSFEKPQGVVHYFTPLGMLVRDPRAHEPARIKLIGDRRRRGGNLVHHRDRPSDLITSSTLSKVIAFDLGLSSTESSFLCFVSGGIIATRETTFPLTIVVFLRDVPDQATGNNVVRLSGSTTVGIPIGPVQQGNANFGSFSALIPIMGPAINIPQNDIVSVQASFTLSDTDAASLGNVSIDIIEVKRFLNTFADTFADPT